MKIIFAGTPDFAVPALEKLYKNNYDVQLVITQKDRPRGRGKTSIYSCKGKGFGIRYRGISTR